MAERKLSAPVTREQEYLAAILEELVRCSQLLGALVPTPGRPEVGASFPPQVSEPAPAGPPAKPKRRKKGRG